MKPRRYLISINCQLLLACLLLPALSMAQEVCDNGRDDDNLTDLNDRIDCSCTASNQVVSLIPNPSFETQSECPFTTSQIEYAPPWFNNTFGSTDYMNACGFVPRALRSNGLFPFPDGDGAVATYIYEGYYEYLTTCLDSTMRAGRPYTIVFSFAATSVSNQSNDLLPQCRDTSLPQNPFALTLYGRANCNKATVRTLGCPTSVDANWKVLGTVIYKPIAKWRKLSITFTPAFDVNMIMLGAPCTLPPGYEQPPGSVCSPYFFYDNLILEKTERVNQPNIAIKATGEACQGNLRLTATTRDSLPLLATFQWYANGVALPGAVADTFRLPRGAQPGNYQVRLSGLFGCVLSAAVIINTVPPLAKIGHQVDTVVAGTTLQLTDSSQNATTRTWAFCDGTRLTGKTITLSFKEVGTCCLKLTANQGTCADSVQKCFAVIDKPTINIPNLFTPNGKGYNEVFEIRDARIKQLDCQIFNRWGRRVYTWTGTNGSWDGQLNNAPASEGTYFYIISYIDYLGNNQTAKGHLTLVR